MSYSLSKAGSGRRFGQALACTALRLDACCEAGRAPGACLAEKPAAAPRSRFVPLPEAATRLAESLSTPERFGDGSLTDARSP
jgi:hypothetical protein